MTADLENLKGAELCEAIYDIMNLRVGSQTFTGWPSLSEIANRDKQWVYKQYIPWLKKEHPGEFENVETVLQYGKNNQLIRKSVPTMAEIMAKELDPQMMMEMYKAEVATQIQGNVGTKVKAMLDSMESDLLTARAVTLQACMLAITGYFASIQKKIKDGKEIYAKEFKTAYEIYKTEMGEPIKIKETRMKNMQVTLQVPISGEEIKDILGNKMRQDLSIEVAEEFQSKLDEKFTPIEVIDDNGH